MTRKMQPNAPRSALIPTDHSKDRHIAYRLMLDGAVVLLIAMMTFGLLLLPVHAAEPSPQQMTVMAENLPADFNAKSASIGFTVLDVEHLDIVQGQIISLALNDPQLPADALKTLSATFPGIEFILMDDADIGFGVAGN